MTAPRRKVGRFLCGQVGGAVTKKCVCVFVCVQIICNVCFFGRSESAPDGA